MSSRVSTLFRTGMQLVLLTLVSCSGAQKTTQETPTTEETKKDTVQVVVKESKEKKEEKPDSLDLLYPVNRKDTYNITYCLPLFLNEYPSISPANERFANIALDFWWGAQLAFDTLENIGLSAKVNVIDSRNDTAQIDAKLAELKEKPDLLMGPLFPANVAHLKQYSMDNKVNIVSPLATIDACEDYNNRTIFSKPTTKELNKATAQLIINKYGTNYPIVIFCRSVSFEKEEAEQIKSFLPEEYQELVTIDEVAKNYIEKDYLRNKLPDSSVVVICSSRESFVTSIIAELRRSLHPHKVIGKESWLDFQSMDPLAWERLSMHFISTLYIDYSNELLISFITKYRHKYHTEPSKYAMAGYFETIYYGIYLELYGTNFQRFNNELQLDLPCADIHLKQSFKCKNYFNNNIRILRLKKQELVEAQ